MATAEIEKADNTYETFGKELLAKISMDDLKAAGYDMDLPKVHISIHTYFTLFPVSFAMPIKDCPCPVQC